MDPKAYKALVHTRKLYQLLLCLKLEDNNSHPRPLDPQQWATKINKYNKDYSAKIFESFDINSNIQLDTQNIFSSSWIEHLSDVIKARTKINTAFAKKSTMQRITNNIAQRCEIIQSNIKKWTSSVLDR